MMRNILEEGPAFREMAKARRRATRIYVIDSLMLSERFPWTKGNSWCIIQSAKVMTLFDFGTGRESGASEPAMDR
jgi:hypothetical protein